MFESSLLESSGRLRSRPGWTTAASVALQSLALGLFVLIPLLHTEALPALRTVVAPVPVPLGTPSRIPPGPKSGRTSRAFLSPDSLVAPPPIPPTIAEDIMDDPPGPPHAGTQPGGGCLLCSPDGVPRSVGDFMRTTPPPVPPPPPQRMVVSAGVTAGQLIHRVQPVYPKIALLAGIEGTVVLHAIISKTGTIESLRVVSGHPMLQQAAVDAVQQWRYRPFFLGSVPVEVETQITVNFILARNR
ncbi:MAG TPA: energy transducer TonB [Terriglobales bacterium]|nr:energy transducer TonB [Terriglobales bacterium]